MKLNLAPSKVRKGGSLVGAIIGSTILALLSLAAFAFMLFSANAKLDAATQRVADERPNAERAVATAKAAQTIVDSTSGIATNLTLAKEMNEANYKYTRLYSQIRTYIPSFLRITGMSVDSIDEKSCNLNLSGVLYSAQQYADATLSLFRIPGAMAISRSGYTPRPVVIPGLSEDDQIGRAFRVGSEPLPVDPSERLNAIIAKAEGQTIGFANLNNFGAATPDTRGPMQTGAAVTYSVLLSSDGAQLPDGWSFDFMVPDAAATLTAAASANPALPAGGGGAAGGVNPNPDGGPLGGGGRDDDAAGSRPGGPPR